MTSPPRLPLFYESSASKVGRKEIQPLTGSNWRLLEWENSSFSYPGMVRITTIDGFFHVIASAYFIPYRIGIIDGVPINRIEFINNMRHELADKLADLIDPNSLDDQRYYDKLGRGTNKYSLTQMQEELRTGQTIDNIYHEYVSNIIDRDIYLLDLEARDIYLIGNEPALY